MNLAASQALQAGVRNVQQNIAGLKTTKEFQQDEDPEKDKLDIRMTSKDDPTGADHLQAAASSGLMSEIKGKEKNRDSREVEDGVVGMWGGEREEDSAPAAAAGKGAAPEGVEALNLRSQIDSIALQKGSMFPQEQLDAARKIVDAQIDQVNNKASNSLSETKIPERTEVGAVHTAPVGVLPIGENIHDTANEPIFVGSGELIPQSTEGSAASF
jgi:hypothetical protein